MEFPIPINVPYQTNELPNIKLVKQFLNSHTVKQLKRIAKNYQIKLNLKAIKSEIAYSIISHLEKNDLLDKFIEQELKPKEVFDEKSPPTMNDFINLQVTEAVFDEKQVSTKRKTLNNEKREQREKRENLFEENSELSELSVSIHTFTNKIPFIVYKLKENPEKMKSWLKILETCLTEGQKLYE